MKEGNAKRVLELIEAKPGLTRGQIMQELGLRPRQANNALWRLKEAERIECGFAGRYSTWTVKGLRPVARPASNVWEFAQMRSVHKRFPLETSEPLL
jgi:hypothetical protein